MNRPTGKQRAELQAKAEAYLERKAARVPTAEQQAKRKRALDALTLLAAKTPTDAKN